MAITINTQPPLFTTLNASIWKVTSSRPTILAFKVQVIDVASATVIATQQYATLPMSPLSATFDVAPLLASVVDYELRHDPYIELSITRNLKKYEVSFTEMYVDVNGSQVEGDILVSDEIYIFNASLSRPEFAVFNYNKYVMLQGNPQAKFLSNRPLVSNIYYSGLEYLYFMTSEDSRIRLRFYKKKGILIAEKIREVTADPYTRRLNLSPAALEAFYGGDPVDGYGEEFTDEFTDEFGSLYLISDADYFTVQLLSLANVPSSELRTYVIKKDDCTKKQVQVLFSNNLGGFDAMTFNYPKQVVTSNKTSIKVNPLQLDSEGNYYDHRNNVFNPEESVTSSKNTNSFSLISDVLTDEMAKFATTLIESDNVYIKLSSGDLLPVPVQSQDYNIGLRRYSTDNNRMSLSFKVYDINFSI